MAMASASNQDAPTTVSVKRYITFGDCEVSYIGKNFITAYRRQQLFGPISLASQDAASSQSVISAFTAEEPPTNEQRHMILESIKKGANVVKTALPKRNEGGTEDFITNMGSAGLIYSLDSDGLPIPVRTECDNKGHQSSSLPSDTPAYTHAPKNSQAPHNGKPTPKEQDPQPDPRSSLVTLKDLENRPCPGGNLYMEVIKWFELNCAYLPNILTNLLHGPHTNYSWYYYSGPNLQIGSWTLRHSIELVNRATDMIDQLEEPLAYLCDALNWNPLYSDLDHEVAVEIKYCFSDLEMPPNSFAVEDTSSDIFEFIAEKCNEQSHEENRLRPEAQQKARRNLLVRLQPVWAFYWLSNVIIASFAKVINKAVPSQLPRAYRTLRIAFRNMWENGASIMAKLDFDSHGVAVGRIRTLQVAPLSLRMRQLMHESMGFEDPHSYAPQWHFRYVPLE
ncbi:hypothetical protein F4778DRAFT_784080 [Xylariomycetidae sp. FL2044]|nr:hypothetical protein F4778DRAFT_784080 [Xylariomycetidae sp. FL2044]